LKDYDGIGEHVDLEELLCAWKSVLNQSLNGEGTSYDPARLNDKQTRCRECNGLDYDCIGYLNEKR
jgi:hypothetical protein